MTENMRDAADRKASQDGIAAKQMDMFVSDAAVGAPSWLDLPDEVRELLIGLMTRLVRIRADDPSPPNVSERR